MLRISNRCGNAESCLWADSWAVFMQTQYVFHGAGGQLHVLEWAAACLPPTSMYTSLFTETPWYGAMQAACNHGREEVAQWLLHQGCKWEGDLAICGKNGHLHFLQWVLEAPQLACHTTTSTNYHALAVASFNRGAAEGGHLQLLTWTAANLSSCYPIDYAHILQAAASEGHLDILKWASHGRITNACSICRAAAAGGHLESLQWLHQQGHSLPWSLEAAEGSSLLVIKWLHSQGCQWSNRVFEQAARAGKAEIIHWAYQQGFTWHDALDTGYGIIGHAQKAGGNAYWSKKMFLDAAVQSGHVSILDWALVNGWRPLMDELLVKGGSGWGPHIAVLEWASQNGFPKTRRAFEEAAASLDLTRLMWLKANRFPWSKTTFTCAISPPYTPKSPSPMRMLIFRWLKANKCPWGKETSLSAAWDTRVNTRDPEPLKWLVTNGCPISVKMVNELLWGGLMGLALWVQRKGGVCNAAAQAQLEHHMMQQQEVCRCFSLAVKVCNMSPQLNARFAAMAAIPWELQERICQLAFANQGQAAGELPA